MQTHTLRPGLAVALEKCDVASAARLLKLHPAMSLLTVTELPGKFFGIEQDIVMFYRSIPFGWGGPPTFFDAFGDAITLIRRSDGMGRPLSGTPGLHLRHVFMWATVFS